MFTKLKPFSFPFPFISFSPKHKTLTTATSSLSTTATSSLSTTATSSLHYYGPSLSTGHQKPPQKSVQQNSSINEESFDEETFTRIYDISALRVPSDRCFKLENCLRGHLLNWPRVPNVARVLGDEIDQEYVTSNNAHSQFDENDKERVNLERRIYGKAEGDGEKLSPVLYRDKLVRSFNTRGYEKFRNLAKLSRPKKRKKDGSEERRGNGKRKDEIFMVEVVGEDEEGDAMSGLLGEEFKGVKKWRGSTRLLLLDERYALKSIEEMPEAVKVL